MVVQNIKSLPLPTPCNCSQRRFCSFVNFMAMHLMALICLALVDMGGNLSRYVEIPIPPPCTKKHERPLLKIRKRSTLAESPSLLVVGYRLLASSLDFFTKSWKKSFIRFRHTLLLSSALLVLQGKNIFLFTCYLYFAFSREDLSRTILCHFQAWPETLQRKIYIYISIWNAHFKTEIAMKDVLISRSS